LDTDKDGVADKDESGVADIIVKLLDAAGNLVDTTLTDSDGHFEFLALPGDYQLEFVPMEGMEFTLQNQGDDSLDSDVDPENGRTALIQLMNLSAVEDSSGVTVEWATGIELFTSGFDIYRSRDGKFENAVALTEGLILARGGYEAASHDFLATDSEVGKGDRVATLLPCIWLV